MFLHQGLFVFTLAAMNGIVPAAQNLDAGRFAGSEVSGSVAATFTPPVLASHAASNDPRDHRGSTEPDRDEQARERRIALFAVDDLLERAAAPDIDDEQKAQLLNEAWEFLAPMAFDPLLEDPGAWERLGRFALEAGETGPVSARELAGIAAEAFRRVGNTDEQLRLAGRLEVLAGRGVSDRVQRLRKEHMATFTAAAEGDPEASIKLAELFDPEKTDQAESPVLRHPAGVVYWLENAADTGDTEAMNRLAVRLLGGWGVPADHRRAVELAEAAWDASGDQWSWSLMMWAYINGIGIDEVKDRATFTARLARADSGDLRAMSGVGLMLLIGRGGQGNENDAARWFHTAANQGSSEAKYNLGGMYQNGLGVPKDEAEAVRWFRLGSDKGIAAAQHHLAYMYSNGLGVPKNEAKAVRLVRKAAEQGFAEAQQNLGWMYLSGHGVPRDPSEAERWARKAAEQGFAEAQHNLGWMYLTGQGVPRDDDIAVQWYRKAAEQGFALTQFNLGVMYEHGQSVHKDEAEAVRWYRRAADRGLAKAQHNLGVMLASGRGEPKNQAEAVRWFRLAADQGYARAQSDLGVMYLNGWGDLEENAVEAIRWFRKASDQGHADAQHNLGSIYYVGRRGVPKDEAEAFRWFRLAARQGHPRAQQLLQHRGESW